MSAPRWLVFILGLFGVTLLAKNAVAGQPGASAEPPTTAPGTILPAKYPYELEISAAARKYKVDPDLIAATMAWEGRGVFNPMATNPDDPSYGLGQVTPYIAVRFGIIASAADYRELYIPEKNARAVAAFYDYLLKEMRYPLAKAIQCYNLGEPKYWDGFRVPDYLKGVMDYYKKYSGKEEPGA